MSMSPTLFACVLTVVVVLGACWLASKKSVFLDCVAGISVFFLLIGLLLHFLW